MTMSSEINDIKEFANFIAEAIKKQKGADYRVEINDTLKNNDTNLVGITVLKSGQNVAPTVYLEDRFAEYQKGKDLDEIATEFIRDYDKATGEINTGFDVNFINDFERVKDYIFIRLINAKTNKQRLKDVPHKIICTDLAIVFYVLVAHDEVRGLCSSIVKNDLTKVWQVDTDQLMKLALVNTPRLFKGVIFPTPQTMIFTTNKESFDDGTDNAYVMHVSKLDKARLYTCTNLSALNGAAAILYDGLLEDFANTIGSDFYMLPSSIHEVLFVPSYVQNDKSVLKSMVVGANKSVVSKEEILSNSVYIYRRKKGTLEKCH